MKRMLIILAVTAALLAAAAPARAASPAQVRLGCWIQPGIVAVFDPGDNGSFLESMAADQAGNLFASLTVWGLDSNTGQIWRITPGGRKSLVATADIGPTGMLTGLAFDDLGRLYVGLADFADPAVATPGVFRMRVGSLTRVLTLPGTSFPNGLAFHSDRLYVSDSSVGAVWRVRPGRTVSPTKPWLQDDLLLPGDTGLGANGIAFRQSALTIAVSDAGRIVRVPMRTDGSAGTPVVVAEKPELVSADGIAFDRSGGLWIVTNENGLLRLTPSGGLKAIATDPGWLDYPTMPVFGTVAGLRTMLYIANGSFEAGTPNIAALAVGVRGLPLR